MTGSLDERFSTRRIPGAFFSPPDPWRSPNTYPYGDTVYRYGKVEKELGELYRRMKCEHHCFIVS